MRILVFDDKEINRAAAQAQLKDHKLIVVGTYDEAEKQLWPDNDWVLADIKSQFGDFNPYHSDDKAKVEEYWVAQKLARETHSFDAVLTDLFVPASGYIQDPSMALAGTVMPIGIFFGLLAAVKWRVKYVAVFTDINHHHHPAVACFDLFSNRVFTIEGSKVILANMGYVHLFSPDDLTKPLEVQRDYPFDTVWVKNWAELLAELIA